MSFREQNKTILAHTTPEHFVGRDAELDRLIAHAGDSGRLDILCEPYAGGSELLRQAYDLIFSAAGNTVPFYFRLAKNESPRKAALRFLQEYIASIVAFRRRGPAAMLSASDVCELARIASPQDAYWIDALVDATDCESRFADERSFIQTCLRAPLRAAGHGTRTVLLIDDIHISSIGAGQNSTAADLLSIYSVSLLPVIFSGLRRSPILRRGTKRIDLERLSPEFSGQLIEKVARENRVPITEQTRDLIAIQLGGDAGAIRSFLISAAQSDRSLATFAEVERHYTDEMFGGNVGRRYEADLRNAIGRSDLIPPVVQMLASAIGGDKISGRDVPRSLNISQDEAGILLDRLNVLEYIGADPDESKAESLPIARRDHILSLNALLGREPRAVVVGNAAAGYLQRAPKLMAAFYRRMASIPLRDLLTAFGGKTIPAALIDHSIFREHYKGLNDTEIEIKLAGDTHTITLPQTIYSAYTENYYPQLSELIETERAAIAICFEDAGLTMESAWLAVQLESKLEAVADIAEYWCDRLEMVALNAGFQRFKLWLITPEGFDADAHAVLRERNAFGTGRRQIELLFRALSVKKSSADTVGGVAYEISLPMGADTEMIAANALDDIGKRHNLPQKTINQVKTALVEVCINAAEHSLSPDQRIYQRFTLSPGRLTVNVANRGIRLLDRVPKHEDAAATRRGWGLQLIKGLMDEVTIDPVDDGTSITMVKYFEPEDR